MMIVFEYLFIELVIFLAEGRFILRVGLLMWL